MGFVKVACSTNGVPSRMFETQQHLIRATRLVPAVNDPLSVRTLVAVLLLLRIAAHVLELFQADLALASLQLSSLHCGHDEISRYPLRLGVLTVWDTSQCNPLKFILCFEA
jgi:hypothetical protein